MTDPPAAPVADGVTVDVHLGEDWFDAALCADAAEGLTATPKTLSPLWFYDEVGSVLFDAITRLPEYYPTRTERAILAAAGADIATTCGAETLVELGSGTCDKAPLLLDAMVPAGLRRYVPFDVSEATLRDGALRVAARYPALEVHGVVGDFHVHLDRVPVSGPVTVAFLGSTIGNQTPPERARFLAGVAAVLSSGDHLVLGVDLIKDPRRLVAAYDDPVGVTAAFNRNALAVLNRRLDADFDPAAFDHEARWDPGNAWIEMHLRARGPQRVNVRRLDLAVSMADGETIRTEISAKFRPELVREELSAAGFDVVGWHTDPDGDFAVVVGRHR